ncbi:hypothetical protein [uncultured Sphingomonas sp.]|uniref:DUF6414 family protein n=1 Tax=uncultured Sphingomonas sp. TaxID=158754 RepID=UPI002639FA23|nr:hypothetical protein [uncultured Sphingomonas sp.]
MIRNFLYLDSTKLRSISSQVFEGITNQLLLTELEKSTEQESQKGPLSSGKVLADIFSKEKSSAELKFLEDHAYTILEDKLRTDDMLISSDDNDFAVKSTNLFVKIDARLTINDVAATHGLLSNFNEIGEAFWRVANTGQSSLTSNGKPLPDDQVRKLAAAAGMQLDKKFIAASSKLIEFGFGGMIEASMLHSGYLFSAPLKREFLRESESMILHKYSRFTQSNFTMIGLVTQIGGGTEQSIVPPDVSTSDGVKSSMRSLAVHMRVLEQVFSGPSQNEIIIDPIAIYAVI